MPHIVPAYACNICNQSYVGKTEEVAKERARMCELLGKPSPFKLEIGTEFIVLLLGECDKKTVKIVDKEIRLSAINGCAVHLNYYKLVFEDTGKDFGNNKGWHSEAEIMFTLTEPVIQSVPWYGSGT